MNLQHLDVAYNLLLEHALLAPLSTLHGLRKVSAGPADGGCHGLGGRVVSR